MKLIIAALLCTLVIYANAQTYSTVSTFAGTSVPGLLDGPVNLAKFNSAHNMCVDNATNTVYVADSYNNAIRKIRNGVVSTLAGNGTVGDVDGQGTNARFYSLTGIQFYNGYIYVTDNGNHKIKRVDTLGNVTTIAGTGVSGFADGPALSAKFKNPTGLSIDHNGTIYVADYGNDCIRRIKNDTVTLYAGTVGVIGDQLGAALSAKFYQPSEVLIDQNDSMLYVSDLRNHKVKAVSPSGIVTLVAGSGIPGLVDGTGASAEFNFPSGMLWDLWGNIIIADALNNVIRRITTTGVVTTIAGTGSAGLNNGPVASATFSDPTDICSDANGNIYVGDAGNSVIRMITVGDLGMENHSLSNSIIVFPNPSADHLVVNNSDHTIISSLRIFDANGKLVQDIHLQKQSDTTELDISALSSGTYFLEVVSDKKSSVTEFVKD